MLYDANKDWSWPVGYIYNYGSNTAYSAYYNAAQVPEWKANADPYPSRVRVGQYVYEANSRYVSGNKESPLTAVDDNDYRMWSLACSLTEYKSRWLSSPVEMMFSDGNKYFDDELEAIEPPPTVNYAAAYSPYPSTEDYKTDAEADYMHSVVTSLKYPNDVKTLYGLPYEGIWTAEDIDQKLTLTTIKLPGLKASQYAELESEMSEEERFPSTANFVTDSPDYPGCHDENDVLIFQKYYDGNNVEYDFPFGNLAKTGGVFKEGTWVVPSFGSSLVLAEPIGFYRWTPIPVEEAGGLWTYWDYRNHFQGIQGTRPIDNDRPTKATITYRHKMTVYHPFYVGRKFIGSAIFLESTTSAWGKVQTNGPYEVPGGNEYEVAYGKNEPIWMEDILEPGHLKIKRIAIEYEITWQDLYGHDDYRAGDETDDKELEVEFADMQAYPEFIGIFLEKVTPDCSDD